MKYRIFTYGCQMNHSDSEKIATRLKEMGYKPAKDAAAADLIVVNFCSVRQSAVHRALAQLDKYKKKRLIAAGCLLPADQKKLAAKNITYWHPDDYFLAAPLHQNKFTVLMPIMTGCDNFCSYCAVPYTRGREKSRPAKEVLAEIKKALKNGAKEIILLGQNVNSYRSLNTDFPALLQKINDLPGNFWLSFLSSHPKDLSDEMIKMMAECKKITPYLHLPAQSGDDKILRAMNRRYTVDHYKNLIKKIRSAFARHRRASADKSAFTPLAVSTDIIVGFPGETLVQFKNSLKLIREINFDMVYFARYSPRAGTAAAKLKDNVLPAEKMRRAQAINSLLKQQCLAINKKYINHQVDVLIEKIKGPYAFGKTSTNKSVRLPCRVMSEANFTRPRKKLKPGQFITAKIISVTAWGLNAIPRINADR